MIQPLRTAHRRAWLLLGIMLPAVLVAGLTARRPQQQESGSRERLPRSAGLLYRDAGMWRRHVIVTEIYGVPEPQRELQIVLQTPQPLSAPDVLLYWSGMLPDENTLPAGAQLLGPFEAGSPIALPQAVVPGSHLILYSLAHQRVVDSAMLRQIPRGERLP